MFIEKVQNERNKGKKIIPNEANAPGFFQHLSMVCSLYQNASQWELNSFLFLYGSNLFSSN